MLKKLRTVIGEGFESIVWYDDVTNYGFFLCDLDIDSDGGENVDGDKYWQPETSLKFKGKSINALLVPGVVLPGWLPGAVKPIVLGCLSRLTNLQNMKQVNCVVHDTGPLTKIGEATPRAAQMIGINPNSVSGGEERPIILCQFWPGQPANVVGIQYDLQRS